MIPFVNLIFMIFFIYKLINTFKDNGIYTIDSLNHIFYSISQRHNKLIFYCWKIKHVITHEILSYNLHLRTNQYYIKNIIKKLLRGIYWQFSPIFKTLIYLFIVF